MSRTEPGQSIPDPLEEHRSRIAKAVRDAPELVVCLDFDGTLAPIVEDPDAASPLDAAETAVRSLADTPAITTAIVSGRSLLDVRERIDGPSIFAGNHGLEIQRHGAVAIHPIARKRAVLVETVCSILEWVLTSIPNARVENKRLTGTVHHRTVPDPARETVGELTRRITDRVGGTDLKVSDGKRVLEIAPSIPWGKGNAVSLVERGVRSDALTIYIGDDTSDETAFREIEPAGIGVRVGGSDPSWASLRVDSPSAVASFLHWIGREFASTSGSSLQLHA